MRTFIAAVIAVLMVTLGVGGFAQGTIGGGGGTPGPDDHDDLAPIQAGYAVITPASPGTGLAVHQTFGLRTGTETTQAGLPAPDLTTSAAIFADVSNRLTKNLGLAIVNPHSSTATVSLTLRKADGTTLAAKTITVDPRHQIAQFVTDLLPVQTTGGSFGGTPTALSEYAGTLLITSNLPVSMLGIRFRGLNFSTVPLTYLVSPTTSLPVFSQGIGGNGALLLPQFAAGGGWATEIVLSNTGTSSITVRVDLFKQDGTPLTAALNGQRASSFTNVTIAGGGVVVLAPRDSNGDDRF